MVINILSKKLGDIIIMKEQKKKVYIRKIINPDLVINFICDLESVFDQETDTSIRY